MSIRAEIVMIGTELLLGQIVDTNASHIAKVLADNGIHLYQKTTVGDNRQRVVAALDAALNRSDIILISGGLGPTEDDLTRDCVADVMGVKLDFREDLCKELAARFERVGRPMTENNKRQAYLPKGAKAIPNPNGTAPGLLAETERGVIICMPGVPFELKAMLDDSVIPYLRGKFQLKGLLHSRVLKVCGMGESRVDSIIGELITRQSNPTIGLLASPEWVRIRITAYAHTVEDAEAMIAPVEEQVRLRLPGLIMGVDDDTLEGVVNQLLAHRGWTLAVAESVTGGMIAQRLTLAGASQFAGGLTLRPQSESHEDLEALARERAAGARERFAADCAMGIVTDLPGSRAIVALLTPDATVHWEARFAVVDKLNQVRVSVMCLERLRRYLANVPFEDLDPKTG